jgi:hypothetical protein
MLSIEKGITLLAVFLFAGRKGWNKSGGGAGGGDGTGEWTE